MFQFFSQVILFLLEDALYVKKIKKEVYTTYILIVNFYPQIQSEANPHMFCLSLENKLKSKQ